MLRLQSHEDQIVGVLHDVIEDTGHSLDELRGRGHSEAVLSALDCVTKREGEGYEAFVARAATNPIAARVKVADLEDNLDLRRLREVTSKEVERLNRYVVAWHRLRETHRVIK